MDSAQLQAMLREKMERMPNKARRVVEYLLSNTREAAFLSIGEVAEKLDVSKAQLVRVSRMVGFEGYADLKDALQNSVLEHVNPTALLSKIMKNRQDLPEETSRRGVRVGHPALGVQLEDQGVHGLHQGAVQVLLGIGNLPKRRRGLVHGHTPPPGARGRLGLF